MNGWWEGEASVSSPEPFSELADPGNYDSNIFSTEASTDPSVRRLVSSRISLAPEYCPLSLSVRPL